ncbi:MAG: long-chain fatty acid--CoA ligase [Syntrophaceae bacterium]|nr:long-chain fatty acid--CoA ligase [Syntrophaceae bacterium]
MEYPWLKHYDEGIPYSLKPYPSQTLLDIVKDTASQRPHHTALIFKGRRLNYLELEKLSDAFANGLIELGVKKGDRVALILPNSPQLIFAQLGVWKAGGIAVPINPLYTENELERLLIECGAETVVVLTRFYKKIKSLQPHTRLRYVIATNIKEYLPRFLSFLFTLFKEKKEGHRIKLQPNDLWLSDLLRRHIHDPRPNVEINPEDMALLLFSGGTTGEPKGAVGTHQALLMTGMQLRAWFSTFTVEWDDVILLAIPLFHVYGNAGVFAVGIFGRDTFSVVPDPRDIDDLVATIRKTRPTFLPGVPTLFNALLNHPAVQAGKVDFKSTKLCVSGASSLLAEVKHRFEELTGGRVVEGYGLTESMMAAVVTPLHGPYKPGSVGTPLPDVEIRIADTTTGEGSLCPNEVGEILMRAPQLMKGYWQRPLETENTIRDGWLYTGDLGYLDEDGFLFIVDRKKDVIKPSGFQVWPREVEEVIASHPAVNEVGVGGVFDEYQGEAVKAWVVLRSGQKASAEEIRAYCRKKLAGYKVPKHIEFMESLPKTMVGKVLRRELLDQEKSKQNKS